MAIGVPAGARINRDEKLHTRFILKEFGAERAAYRLEWIREPHLLTDIAQSNASLLTAGSAGRRYVVLDGVPANVLSRGHGGLLLIVRSVDQCNATALPFSSFTHFNIVSVRILFPRVPSSVIGKYL